MVQYSWMSTTRLPPPYHTRCGILQAMGYDKRDNCISDCIIKLTLIRYNKLPLSTILVDGDLNYLHLNEIDMKNHSIGLADIELECLANCNIYDCNDIITIPTVETRDTDNFVFRVMMQAPSQLFSTLVFSSRMTFVEFLIYILSTIGSWMGISVLSLTTSILKARHKKVIVSEEPSRHDKNRTKQTFISRGVGFQNVIKVTQNRLGHLEDLFATAQQANDRRLEIYDQVTKRTLDFFV